jgi:hypothetical protein
MRFVDPTQPVSRVKASKSIRSERKPSLHSDASSRAFFA